MSGKGEPAQCDGVREQASVAWDVGSPSSESTGVFRSGWQQRVVEFRWVPHEADRISTILWPVVYTKGTISESAIAAREVIWSK